MPSVELRSRSVETASAQGLVLSPKSRTVPAFAGPEAVSMAAAGLAAVSEAYSFGGPLGSLTADCGFGEGPRHFITVSPGSIKVSSSDLARGQRTSEREVVRRSTQVDELAAELTRDGELVDPGASTRRIYSWSSKSRANMVRRLVSLDYGPLLAGGDLAMLTLTYPGDWLTVAPDSATCAGHLDKLRQRYRKRYGQAMAAVWKREFQLRGAPHYHLLVCPPGGYAGRAEFREWVGSAWADIVRHPDPVQRMNHERAGTRLDWNKGLRMTDPKRVAVYFAKHGLLAGKEYQNHAPAAWIDTGQTVGRFWGVWKLKPAEVPVMVTAEQAQTAVRHLRRWHAAGNAGSSRPPVHVRQVWRKRHRVDHDTGELVFAGWRRRTVRRRISRLQGRAGFLSVNDGPSAAFALEVVLARVTSDRLSGKPLQQTERLALLRVRRQERLQNRVQSV